MKIKFELGAILLIILCLFQQEKVKKYFKPVNVVCQEYNSRDIVKNGTYSRKLIFLEIGEKSCVVPSRYWAALRYLATDLIST